MPDELYRTVVIVDGFEGTVNGLVILGTPAGVDLPPGSARVNLLSFPESMRDSVEKGKCFFAKVNLGAEMPNSVRIEDIEEGWGKTDGLLHFDDTRRRMTDDQIVYALDPYQHGCSNDENEAFFVGARAALAASPSMDALAAEICEWARDKGFYERAEIPYGTGDIRGTVENPSFPSEKVALIMSEGAEVLEALRDNNREEEAAECADIIIRVLDYAHWRGFSMDAEVAAKMEKNRGRPHKHGREF